MNPFCLWISSYKHLIQGIIFLYLNTVRLNPFTFRKSH
uniref:Uncharacterized protein n=1 Tax=Anguilla anguilla TaxID=7936 RepID=A0A0E9UK64_ANGAN